MYAWQIYNTSRRHQQYEWRSNETIHLFMWPMRVTHLNCITCLIIFSACLCMPYTNTVTITDSYTRIQSIYMQCYTLCCEFQNQNSYILYINTCTHTNTSEKKSSFTRYGQSVLWCTIDLYCTQHISFIYSAFFWVCCCVCVCVFVPFLFCYAFALFLFLLYQCLLRSMWFWQFCKGEKTLWFVQCPFVVIHFYISRNA